MHDPNANRPGYKSTKVGWIPEHWDAARIEHFCTLRSGGTPSRTNPAFWNGDIPWATTSEVKYGLVTSTRESITRDGLSGSSACLLPQGTLIAAMYGQGATRGRVALLGRSMAVNQACLAISPKADRALTTYLYHRLTFDYHRLRSYSQGGNQENLSSDLIGMVSLPLPPLPEQEKIASILSTWDDVIEKTRDLIAAKQQQKKALMQQLLTGKRRLPGFAGEWPKCRLGDLFNERRENKANELPLLAITGGRGIIPASDIDRKDSSNVDKSLYKVIKPGDIGYNTMRMWQGVSAVSTLEGIVSPAYTICTPRDSVDVSFISYFFKFPATVHLFWRYSQGMVNDTLCLKYPNFAFIAVTIPELLEQRAIADVLTAADQEIAALEAKLAALKDQKKGLMQKLLTGQVRVRT